MDKNENHRLFQRAADCFQNGDIPAAEKILIGLAGCNADYPEAFHLLGVIALNAGNKERACGFFKRAAESCPDDPKYHYNYGVILQGLGKIIEAVTEYEKVIGLDRDHEGAYNNLGAACRSLGQPVNSERYLRKALALRPGNVNALTNLATALRDQGRIEEALDSYRLALFHDPENHAAHSNLLLCMHYLEECNNDELLADHVRWQEIHCPDTGSFSHPASADFERDRKIRIGYVSGDFRSHSVAFFLKSPLFHHNRERFSVFCYSAGEKRDQTTGWFMNLPVTWRDISSVSDRDAARIIYEDRIDILIDCSGHTSANRLRIFAQRPAPVQVTYIGYPDTTGLDEIDYRIVDEWTDPLSVPWKGTEKPARLSGGFLCYTPPDRSPEVNLLPALRKGFITFGSFNNLPKLNMKVMKLWGRLLLEIPGAQLILKTKQFNDRDLSRRFREFFMELGIAEERIKTPGHSPDTFEHLKWYGEIDVALDPFPYNGTATTYEALYMGVPVITLEGDRHSGRVGKSIMYKMGLTRFVVPSFEKYIALGKYLAENHEILVPLRNALRQRVLEKNNGQEFTEKLEELFEWMREGCRH